MENDLFPIGKVVKPHGVKGKVKVKYYGEDLNQFSHYREVLLQDGRGNLQTYEVVEAVSQPPLLILQLKGIDRIEDVTPLIGKEILIRRESSRIWGRANTTGWISWGWGLKPRTARGSAR